MKRFHVIFALTVLGFLCGSTPSNAAIYYVAPNGSDVTGNGTDAAPWFTLNKAWAAITSGAGHTIYMKGGTYYYNETQSLRNKSGLDTINTINIYPVSGQYPSIKPGPLYNGTRGIDIYGNYINIRGLEISYFDQRSSTAFYYGIAAENSNYVTFEDLKVHDNGFGLSIGQNSGNNLIVNSDFYRNSDPATNFGGNVPWGGADGITIRTSDPTKTNTIRGCRMWWNSDDGVDLFENEGTVVIENSWSFWNGFQPGTFTTAGDGNGFKLGVNLTDQSTSVRRILRRNLAFENRSRGWDQNNLKAITYLFNNTAFKNGLSSAPARSFDFWNGTAATIARNNIEHRSTSTAIFNAQASVSFNSFNKDGTPNGNDGLGNGNYFVTDADFLSIDSTGVDGPRQGGGYLPSLNFLKLASTSDLINCGTMSGVSGIYYTGPAPDLGAFETTSTTPCAGF